MTASVFKPRCCESALLNGPLHELSRPAGREGLGAGKRGRSDPGVSQAAVVATQREVARIVHRSGFTRVQ
jgi:hypothetical protein